MKHILSFFILLIYIFVGFFHNPMSTFAIQENNAYEMNVANIQALFTQNTDCCGGEVTNNNPECKHECCYKSDGVIISSILNISHDNNKKSKTIISNFIDIHFVSINLFLNKKLVKKTSPPLINRDIKNYSYSDLIKIIKSNT